MGIISYIFIIFISLFSSIVFISAILYSDRKSKEPSYMIMLALFSGVFTIATSLIIGQVIMPKLIFLSYESYNFVKVVIFAFLEETTKLTALYFFLQKNSNFDDVYDGFVYSGLIALSFAAFETLMYVFNESDFNVMIQLGILRGITTIPLHLICGIVMGYYVGTEKFAKNKPLKLFKLFNALALPTLIHTVYNYFFTKIITYFNADLPFIIIMIVFFIPFYITGIAYVKRTKAVNDKFISNKSPKGLLNNDEYKILDDEGY